MSLAIVNALSGDRALENARPERHSAANEISSRSAASLGAMAGDREEMRSGARWEQRRRGESQANDLLIEYYFTHFAEG